MSTWRAGSMSPLGCRFVMLQLIIYMLTGSPFGLDLIDKIIDRLVIYIYLLVVTDVCLNYIFWAGSYLVSKLPSDVSFPERKPVSLWSNNQALIFIWSSLQISNSINTAIYLTGILHSRAKNGGMTPNDCKKMFCSPKTILILVSFFIGKQTEIN